MSSLFSAFHSGFRITEPKQKKVGFPFTREEKIDIDKTFNGQKKQKSIAIIFRLSIISLVLYFLTFSTYEEAGLYQGCSR